MTSATTFPDIQILLGLAVAPFGKALGGELAAHRLRHDKQLWDRDSTQALLRVAGFNCEPTNVLEGTFPILVWEGGKVFLRQGNGQWLGVDGKKCKAPALTRHAVGLAVTGVREEAETFRTDVGSILSGFKPQLLQVAIFGIFINMAGLAIPLFSMAVYDRVLPVAATRTLWLLVLGISLCLAFDMALRLLRGYLLSAMLAQANLEQDKPLLARLLRQKGLGTRWSDQLEMMKLGHDVREQMILHILPTLADIPFVLLFLFAITMVAPSLLPVPLALLAVTLLVQVALLPKLKMMARTLTHTAHKRTQVLLETFRSSVAIRIFNRQEEALAKWDVHAASVAQAEATGQFWNGLGQHVTVTMAQLSFVLTLIVGVEQVLGGSLTIGALVATSMLCSRAISPALHLIDTLTRFQGVRAHLRLIRHGLKEAGETLAPTAEKPEVLAHCHGVVSLSGISLARAGSERGILQDLNVRFGAGESWAIAGGVGAGKTSLLSLIAGLVEPTTGDIALEGVSYQRMPVSEVRRHVLLVSQNPVFGDMTVRETICGLGTADETRMQEALAVSGFGAVLAQQGAGLEFRPGPNGERISGGQRHMLALAAAIYQQPKILLLDEPTAQFDPDAERAFCARMKAWLKGRGTTLILVTHRPELLVLADNMLVLVQGKVVMGGPKDQVLKKLQQAQPTQLRKVDHGKAA